MKRIFMLALSLLFLYANAQVPESSYWTKDGKGFYSVNGKQIELRHLPDLGTEVILSAAQLTPAGAAAPLTVKAFTISDDGNKILVYTNSKRVWRYETRGDYWLFDRATNKLEKLGATLPESSLMFAKLSPDGSKAAYVSGHNIYVENLADHQAKALTTNGTDRMINGTFDWVYEEEFGCRDGFRWSPDSKNIAYWNVDANTIRNYYMLNTTDSIYSRVVPVEYPKVGEAPSAVKIGVVNIDNATTTWMNIPGDNRQHYLTRMEWAGNEKQLIIEQLNRKQNESNIMLCDIASGEAKNIHSETAQYWIETKDYWNGGNPAGWDWISKGKEFIWLSEKDGWRHAYAISADGSKERRITNADHDIITVSSIDETHGFLYYYASPQNATQHYLYRARLDGKGSPERVTPGNQEGFHNYRVSNTGLFAYHSFSSHKVQNIGEWVSLPAHKPLTTARVDSAIAANTNTRSNVSYFQVTTSENVTVDAWMVKPEDFDSTKKYPVVFLVYTEPASQTVLDTWGSPMGGSRLYKGNMSKDGYITISIDGRGTPAPKGSAWRKAIYRQVGRVNVRDQALAAAEILKWNFIDTSRVAVWGWSGGGSTTLHLMFQYPNIYKTGISIAPVSYQLSYDNIYQERYMGLPQENKDDFINGSPITYAKNLQGNLLVIHGTGDDNVHYQNTELLINELVKQGKQFSMMAYPNRSHGIFEGAGTSEHLRTLFTNYLRANCPPGAK